MPRPHFQAGAKELEALIEQHKDDAEQLAVLLEELGHRSTPKAITLKSRIARRLAKMAGVGAPIITPPPRPNGPRQPELPLDTFPASTGKSPPDSQVDENTTMGDHGTSPTPKRETSRIRKPGRLPDVPDARPNFTSNKVDIKLSPDTPLIQRYIKSLAFLVADMRRKNSGMRTVTVTDGRRITVDVGGYGYQFVFDGDESLFEGAAIVAEVAGRSCEGQIASVAENRITISLREDLGAEIEFCSD
jgi:hypothetical protein